VPFTFVATNSPGAVDRAVDVAFRRQVQNRIGIEITKDRLHCRTVGDVGLEEMMVRRAHDFGERLAPPGIGQLVYREHLVTGLHRAADDR
jgi:hypothetical protein